ncbi:MAG: hypothetical protein JSR61_04395 [Proteobacteria bacterium]|nr:hypothetical protein [Pseudomonadota bacterium]
MKTLTTLTAAAALIAGMSLAQAQTATSGATTNPGKLNAAPIAEGGKGKSGMQTQNPTHMKGAAKVKTDKQAQSENPASINEKPTQSGSAPASGMESKAAADAKGGLKSGVKTRAQTTGSGSSSVMPNDKSTPNGKVKAKDLK